MSRLLKGSQQKTDSSNLIKQGEEILQLGEEEFLQLGGAWVMDSLDNAELQKFQLCKSIREMQDLWKYWQYFLTPLLDGGIHGWRRSLFIVDALTELLFDARATVSMFQEEPDI